MNVIVLIDGREAIPVRAIPLLTNWRFMSPDIVAHVLGGTGGSNVSLFGDMQSSYIESGKVQPMDKDWWVQFPVKELRALSEKIQIDESSHDVGYSDWRKQSLKELPAGVFIWKDEYQKLHDANWYNRFQMLYGGLRYLNKEGDDNESTEEFEAQMLSDSPDKDLMHDDPLKRGLWSSLEVLKRWREPNYSPFMRSELYAVVMEGFESQVVADTHSAPAVTDSASDGVESATSNWKMQIQAEAALRFQRLRASGASPTTHSILDDMATWCRTNDVKTDSGIYPSSGYLRTHVLGGKHWNPPR